MHDPELTLLRAELSHLKAEVQASRRSARRWRLAGAAVLALAALPLLSPAEAQDAEPPPGLTVKQLRVVDDQGRLRGWFGVMPDGQLGIGLYDEDRNALASLWVGSDGAPRLSLKWENKQRAYLGLANGGAPKLALQDTNGRSRVALTMTDLERPYLSLSGETGYTRAMLEQSKDGGGQCNLWSEENKALFRAR